MHYSFSLYIILQIYLLRFIIFLYNRIYSSKLFLISKRFLIKFKPCSVIDFKILCWKILENFYKLITARSVILCHCFYIATGQNPTSIGLIWVCLKVSLLSYGLLLKLISKTTGLGFFFFE